MTAIRIVRKGGSLPFTFDRGDETVEGWICNIHVKEFKADTAIITRTIELDENNQWTGFITSTESDTLTASTLYRLIALLTNSTTGEEEQIPVRFKLTNAWA